MKDINKVEEMNGNGEVETSNKIGAFVKKHWKKMTAIAGGIGGALVLGYIILKNDEDTDDYSFFEAPNDDESDVIIEEF